MTRQAEPGSIGVHQSSFAPGAQLDGQSAVVAVQAVTAQIMTYLIEMGIDPSLLQLSLSVSSDDMRYLTAKEMADYKVTTAEPLRLPTVSTDKTPPAVTTPQSAAKPAAQTVEDRALSFLARYQAAWSLPNAEALAYLETVYADSISFYGKSVSKTDVLTDKRKFVERWPRRAYSVKHGTEHVSCAAACTVSGAVEWFAESPDRGKMSSGSAKFTLEWDPSSGKVLSEIGKVISTDRNASGPTRILAQWQEENGNCRGGPGNSDETTKACGRRKDIGAKLEAVGNCYGRPGEYGYQMDWHRCDARDKTQTVASNSNVSTVGGGNRPDPRDYPARAVLRGKTRLPDFQKRDRSFNSFRTRIREGMREGPNFAGHYSLIQIGCGTGCSSVIVGDNQTGRPSNFPLDGENSLYLQLKFALSSRLLTTQWYREGERCYVEFFDFDGGVWKSLKKTDVGAVESCYRDIEENLQ